MNAESGDQLHHRFKKHLVYLVLVMMGLFVSANWNELFRFVDDPTTREGFHWILVHLSLSGVLFLLLLIILGSTVRIILKVKKSTQASSVFNDEFHDRTEKKAALFGVVATMLALAALSFVARSSLSAPALSATLIVEIALIVSVVSFVGSYLFYERGQ